MKEKFYNINLKYHALNKYQLKLIINKKKRLNFENDLDKKRIKQFKVFKIFNVIVKSIKFSK